MRWSRAENIGVTMSWDSALLFQLNVNWGKLITIQTKIKPKECHSHLFPKKGNFALLKARGKINSEVASNSPQGSTYALRQMIFQIWQVRKNLPKLELPAANCSFCQFTLGYCCHLPHSSNTSSNRDYKPVIYSLPIQVTAKWNS